MKLGGLVATADSELRIPLKVNAVPEEGERHSGMMPNADRSAATLAF
jgi:hypothetical protein